MKRLALRALLIPAYGLAALGTAAAYLHFSVGIVAGFDGIAQGRYFLGPILSILSALAVLALWRVWSIGARLWRYGAYASASPQARRYDAAGVAAAAATLIGFGAIAKPIYRTEEVLIFGILLGPAAVIAIIAFIRSLYRSQASASATAVGGDDAFVAPLHLADLPGLVCGTAIGLLGIDYLVPRPFSSGWGPCKWTVLYPFHPALWPVERPIAFDGCDDSAQMLCSIGISLSLVCLLAGATAAYIGKSANAARGAVSASLAVAIVLTALSVEVLRAPHPQSIDWVRSIVVSVFIVVGAGWLGYVGGKAATWLWRPGFRSMGRQSS
jgi:hypothetical protein